MTMRALTFGMLLAFSVAACGGDDAARPQPRRMAINVDGSSTVFPLVEALAEGFQAESGIRVSVGESGTGGGIRKLCRGEVQVVGASRPILAEEIAACAEQGVRFVEAPIAFDGLTVVVHPSNPLQSATLDQLKRIWEPAAEGVILNWRQIDPRWPDLELQLYGAGTASGTFDYFTEAVMGAAKASRTDYTPTEDDNITVQGVSRNPGALGYFGYAYYEQNSRRLRALAIDAGEGPVAPSAETIADGSYPLARPLFVYVNAEELRRPQLQRFALYLMKHAARLAPTVGYVPLPERAYETYATRLRARSAGTAFGGSQEVGVDLDAVMARPLEAGSSQ